MVNPRRLKPPQKGMSSLPPCLCGNFLLHCLFFVYPGSAAAIQHFRCQLFSQSKVSDCRRPQARFPSKRNARNASSCVWMETGLQQLTIVSGVVAGRRRNPCAINNGGCCRNAICIPFSSRYRWCRCKPGFTKNGHRCTRE